MKTKKFSWILSMVLLTLIFSSCDQDQQAAESSQSITSDSLVTITEIHQKTIDSLESIIEFQELIYDELADQYIDELLDPGKKTKTYTDREYGFSFSYPGKSILIKRKDRNYQYIRAGNHFTDKTHGTSESDLSLPSDKYSLEIMIYDNEKGHPKPDDCKNCVTESSAVSFGKYKGFRGKGTDEGDAGGFQFVLCIEDSSLQFCIQGFDNDSQGKIINTILDSFSFQQ
jgi:hypothetical protein